MICSNCGAKLKEGYIYCSVCGKEVQVVDGLTDLEDDYLRSILKETEKNEAESRQRVREQAFSPQNEKKGHMDEKKKISNKIPIIIVLCILLVGIIAGISIKLYINYQNDNSYDYQMAMAEKELVDHNYENALDYFSNALAIAPNDVTARMKMAEIYMQRKEYDSAMVLLIEVIRLDPKNAAAYQNLIQIYASKEDYEQIKKLAEGIEDKEILKLFSDYLVSAPVYYPVGGFYDTFLTVTLISVNENDIYYTTDGSDPIKNGKLYKKDAIKLEKSGNYMIKSVCCNENGIYSDVKEYEYEIKIKAPDYPTVIPNGGTFTEPMYVTIEADEECSVYYTWDGTTPSKFTDQYIEPIEIPEGNNVLSIIVIDDRSGLSSEIYRVNYIYESQEEE